MTELNIQGVKGQIVAFQGNLVAKQAVYTVALTTPGGAALGQIQLGIKQTTQEETETQTEIPGWDAEMAGSVKAQALFTTLQEYGLELADNYSKLITVPEPAPEV